MKVRRLLWLRQATNYIQKRRVATPSFDVRRRPAVPVSAAGTMPLEFLAMLMRRNIIIRNENHQDRCIDRWVVGHKRFGSGSFVVSPRGKRRATVKCVHCCLLLLLLRAVAGRRGGWLVGSSGPIIIMPGPFLFRPGMAPSSWRANATDRRCRTTRVHDAQRTKTGWYRSFKNRTRYECFVMEVVEIEIIDINKFDRHCRLARREKCGASSSIGRRCYSCP
jgi:hypothetical protein